MSSHLLWMVLHATLVAAFLCVLWRQERQERIRFFTKVWGILVLGGIALAWLMYWMPSTPPISFPV